MKDANDSKNYQKVVLQKLNFVNSNETIESSITLNKALKQFCNNNKINDK